MTRLLSLFAFALSFVAASPAAFAQAPQPPDVAAKSYVLVDLTTRKTLAERNADVPADPASLTKLMTAYLVFHALKDGKLTLEQTLPVSKRAWDERKGGASVMFIDTTMTPKVDELLKGMIVQSGNDATVALAEGVAGSVESFVETMNKQAQAWGLKNTTFTNTTGISEAGHSSTARDTAVIAAKIIEEFPQYFPYYSIRDYTYNKIRQDNRNLLLGRDPTVDGMKTGHTEAAGYCLVATAQREFPNLSPSGSGGGKRRLLTVVLGTASRDARASESQKLLNWGFTAYDALRLFEAGKTMVEPEVWKGTAKTAKLGAAGPLLVSVPRGEGAKLQTKIERSDPLVAPLAEGQRVGRVLVTTASGAPVAEVPLVVQQAVPEAGIFGRAWDSLRLWIR